MVEGGFLNKPGAGSLVLERHGLVLKQTGRDVVIEKVLSGCRADLEKGDIILTLNGINVSKAALVHKALSESHSGHRLEISRGSGRVSEVIALELLEVEEELLKAEEERIIASVSTADKAPAVHSSDAEEAPCAIDEASTSKNVPFEAKQDDSAVEEVAGVGREAQDAADEAKHAGNQAFKSGDMELAVAHFTEAIRLRPGDFSFFSNRSAALLALGRYAEAESDGRTCVELKPDIAKSHFRLAQALLASGKDKEGVASLQRACDAEPLNAQLRGALARATRNLAAKNQKENPPAQPAKPAPKAPSAAAKSFLEGGASKDAEMAAKAFERATRWAENNEFLRAAEGFTEAINLAPKNPAYFAARSAALLKASKFDDALEDASRALALRPDYPLGAVRKGQALAMLGRMDLSIETLEKAVQQHPDDAQLKQALGDIRAVAGRMAGVLAGKNEMLDMVDDEMNVNVEIPQQVRSGDSVSVTVNVPAFGQVKTTARVPEGKKGGDSFMVNLGTREDLADRKKDEGNAAYKTGRMQKALDDYTTAIALNPNKYAYFANRSGANYTLGKFKEALEDADAALRLQPGFGRALFRRGQALSALCDFDAAIEALEEARRVEGEGAQGVEEALARAVEDRDRLGEGKVLQRQETARDTREASEYIIHKAQLHVERRLEEQWRGEQAKKKDVESKRLAQAAKHVTSEALLSDISVAKWGDKNKADTERAKFQAVAQRVEYDQFEQMVAGASLKSIKTRSGSQQAGIIIAAGSDSSAEGGLAAKVVNVYGEGRKKQWLPGFEAQGDAEAAVSLPSELVLDPGAKAPTNLKEFNVAWRKLKGDARGRYGVIKMMAPAGLKQVFRTEMDSDTLCEMVAAMSLGGGLEQDQPAACIEFLDALRRLPRFELNSRFLSKKDTAAVASIIAAGDQATHGQMISDIKAGFGC